MADSTPFELQHCLLDESEILPMLEGRRRKAGGRVMDPKAQVVADFSNSVRVPPEAVPLPDLRKQLLTLVGLLDVPAPELHQIRDIRAPGGDGEIAARVYRPSAGAEKLPVLAFFHGGGWVQGDLDSHHGLCARLALWSGAMVVSFDYRLAPEHPFPAGVEDCLAAYRWLRGNAGDLGGDPARVAVGGDSAGGNLSIVVSQQAAKSGETPPDFQLLIYPATDFAMDTASHAEFEQGAIIPRDRILWYMKQYLADERAKADTRASPIRMADLQGQPPALVQTAGFDPLRDEAKAYADRLAAAGVDVTYHEYPGQIHGFMMLAKAIPQGLAATREAADYMRRQWSL
ncbi:alpha/beta hydrolase [Minwuia thermotolerans]|uniref:Acetyl hydrolase n=1 Tax=Minwuia thermotolerans TaxID=2056226 RepID=A0A2M9G0B0_9PROT|nr:alpha/beta hydrolase [Minwuia thermotolerans]PJK29114.1 acetyl hydrolase [Minwuia thermotolerans]